MNATRTRGVKPARYKHVRGLARGLDVLAAIGLVLGADLSLRLFLIVALPAEAEKRTLGAPGASRSWHA